MKSWETRVIAVSGPGTLYFGCTAVPNMAGAAWASFRSWVIRGGADTSHTQTVPEMTTGIALEGSAMRELMSNLPSVAFFTASLIVLIFAADSALRKQNRG